MTSQQSNSMKYIKSLIVALLALFALPALAVQITVPSATAFGQVLIGQVTGNYTPVATSTLGLRLASTTLLGDTNTFSGPTFHTNTVSLGTTTPFGLFSEHLNPTATYRQFPILIGSSTQTATSTLFSVDSSGNLVALGQAFFGTGSSGSTLTMQGSTKIGRASCRERV